MAWDFDILTEATSSHDPSDTSIIILEFSQEIKEIEAPPNISIVIMFLLFNGAFN